MNAVTAIAPAIEPVAARIARLQAEARAAAKEHVRLLQAQMIQTQLTAEQIAAGGESYPVGLKELARTLAQELERVLQRSEAISARGGA